jgi:hypothetical protein
LSLRSTADPESPAPPGPTRSWPAGWGLALPAPRGERGIPWPAAASS